MPDRELSDNDYTPMMLQQSLDDDSVKLQLDTFPVSSTTFIDHEPPSKDHEDDHIIPATLHDKPVDGSTLVDPDAKTDNVPQI